MSLVLVAGPSRAGCTSLAAALRERMPEHAVVESNGSPTAQPPAAVVFVVSAVAPVAASDCDLLDQVSRRTALIVGAVSKIDAHRRWREVLAADRALIACRAPGYRHLPWVGVAAGPGPGPPILDELVGLLRERLADPDLPRRNRLRSSETQLCGEIEGHSAVDGGPDRRARVAALRALRSELVRSRRSAAEHSAGLRGQVQQARVRLTYFARNRCAALRIELQADAAEFGCAAVGGLTRRGLDEFERAARRRLTGVLDEVDAGVTEHLAEVAQEFRGRVPALGARRPSPAIPAPVMTSRRLQNRLMMVLGAGFGLGVSAAVSRLLAGVAPGLALAALAVGAAVGLVLALWVVGMRGLLHDRSVLDRWVADAVTALRSSTEELVTIRALTAEAALVAESVAVVEQQRDSAAERIRVIDAELREHAAARSRATELRDQKLPELRQELRDVRAALYQDS